ncbi:MAG TPA: hypothetical protein VFP09_08630 [Desertimonas sp.]|nr:hypothetical protein [Desertimonas sp.]
MTADVAEEVVLEPAGADDKPGWRSAVATICGVFAVVCLTLALIGVWARATVFDSDKVGDIVSSALADPEVEAGLAAWVTNELFTAIDVESRVTTVLPSNLDRLAPTLTAGAQSFVDSALTRVIGNPEVQQFLTDAVERAHSALMQLLSGDGLVDGITVEEGAVTVNFLPLVSRALTSVQGLGLFDQLDVPTLTRAGDPTEQIAELEKALGRDLPDDFGQLTVFQSDKLADAQASVQNAQRAMVLLKRATWLFAVLAVVLLVATVMLAHNRLRAGLWLALGCVVAMVLSRTVVHRVVDDAPSLVPGAAGQAAIADILAEATRGLLRLTGLFVILAVLVVVWTLFRRGWIGHDLLLVGAVVLGLAVVVVLGFSIGSLLLGVVLALAAMLLVPRLFASKRQVAVTT